MVPVSAGWLRTSGCWSQYVNQSGTSAYHNARNLPDRCERLLCRAFSLLMESQDGINRNFHWTFRSGFRRRAGSQSIRSNSCNHAWEVFEGHSITVSHQVPTSFPDVDASSAVEEQDDDGYSHRAKLGRNQVPFPCGKVIFINEVINQATNTRRPPSLFTPVRPMCPKHWCFFDNKQTQSKTNKMSCYLLHRMASSAGKAGIISLIWWCFYRTQ